MEINFHNYESENFNLFELSTWIENSPISVNQSEDL